MVGVKLIFNRTNPRMWKLLIMGWLWVSGKNAHVLPGIALNHLNSDFHAFVPESIDFINGLPYLKIYCSIKSHSSPNIAYLQIFKQRLPAEASALTSQVYNAL